MNRNFTLIALAMLSSCLFTNNLSATVYTNNGTATTYTLNAGDSLSIASGTYTGTISSFAAGAKIAVQTGAIFQPVSMAFPNVRGTIYVYGQFKMTSQLRTNTGFALHNYGITWVTSTTLMSGNTQSWTNYYGGLMKLDGDVSITNDNAITNKGIINCGANLTMTGTCSITNRNAINVAGSYTNSGGTLTNQGRFQTTGSITFNNGLATVYNHCRMISSGGIFNTTGLLYNYGYLWSKSGVGSIVNSGSITNGPTAKIHGATLNNTGTITGSGFLYFTGNTSTTNLGTTGVLGITTDTIKIYDVTRTNSSTVYDNQTGIVYPNTIYKVFTAPDSTSVYLAGCAIELMSEIPLAVNWNYFYLSVSNSIPTLDWSANYDAGTIFEVQRSYNGVDFTTIKTMSTEHSKSQYSCTDAQVDATRGIAYYRIKAIEPTGIEKYSETRTTRFTTKTGITIQTAPNPFTSDITIHYQSAENGIITIRVLNLVGQQQLIRQVPVQASTNSITLTEAAKLAKGMYVVQVTRDNKLVAAEKIIKQ